MPHFADTAEEISNLIETRIARLTADDEMLIVPLSGTESKNDLVAIMMRASYSISAKFAGTDSAFAARTYTVLDQRKPHRAFRDLWVATRTKPVAAGRTVDAVAVTETMAAFFPKLVERSKHAYETSVYHDFDGIGSGEQLANTPRFTEVLGWLRGGYTYTVSRNFAGRLSMSY